MLNLKIYTKSHFLYLCLFLLSFNLAFAQNNVNKRYGREGKNHHLYITPDGKVGCTQDLGVVEKARLMRQNRIGSTAVFAPPQPTQTPNLPPPSQSLATATFIVNFDASFDATPETMAAKVAFQKAVDNWASLITSTVTIRIDAKFDKLDEGVLGSTGPFEDVYPKSGANKSWQPTALIEAKEGVDVYSNPDIRITFNILETDFYFGTDGVPKPGKIDFVSVVMHEIGHGLGFTGSGRTDDDTEPPCNSLMTGCWGYDDAGTIYPEIYDQFVQDNLGTPILTLTNPSLAIRTTILSNSLFFDSPSIRRLNGGVRARLYAPSTYDPGSSYSHFSEFTFNGTPNAMMTPTLNFAEVQQNFGPLGCAVFQTIGWTMAGACATALPVELSNFQAVNKGNRNVLTWTTLTETNNKLFKIERSNDGKNFSVIGEIKGAGTTDFPRSYTFYDEEPLSISYYRLRQMDYDDKEKPSNIVSVSLKVGSDIVLFPNPTKDKIAFNTTAFEPNRVVVYNNLGQIVMDKAYQINELDVSSLPVGVYVLELISASSFVGDFNRVNKRFVKN
jgi:Secretion system C-terminal sorting domain